jgi:hypothetical protein
MAVALDMETTYELFVQSDCRKHGREDYGLATTHVNNVRRKHRHYDVLPKQKGDRPLAQICDFLRAKHEQSSAIRQVKNALRDGDIHLACRLATEWTQRYPSHRDLKEYARVLALPRVVNNNVPPVPSIRANYDWLKEHRQQYQGNWIGLRDGMLAGVDTSLENLVKKIGETKGILLTKA